MSGFSTPTRPSKRILEQVTIPPSPFLQKLGYGTGVAVYKLDRSPKANKICSPWAVKKLIKTKIYNKNYALRLKEECEILQKLSHPNIIGFRAVLKSNDNQECLAMEECNFCLGKIIEERRESGALAYPAMNIMKVAQDVAEGLSYLHNQALLLHGDIKSFNILIKDNFRICKLCDFGVTLPLTSDGDLDKEKAGQNAQYIGTTLWSAPEIVEIPQRITTKADIFAYGLVIWEMLALSLPNLEDMNDSYCSTVSTDEVKCGFGKRPDLPDQDFDSSYRYVLEIFHCCTENNMNARPSAQDLAISIPEMITVMDKQN